LFSCYSIATCVSAKEETPCCPDTKVKIFADGSCLWFREFRLSVSHCVIDITWFPFDSQVCDLMYESRNYDSREMNVTRILPVAVLEGYSRNGEWELIGKTTESHDYTKT